MKKVLEVKNISIRSVNDKYKFSRRAGRLVLNKEYKEFKELLHAACIDEKIERPYIVEIHTSMYLDIDNPLKPMLDSLTKVLSNDRDIHELRLIKFPIKRGYPGDIKIYVRGKHTPIMDVYGSAGYVEKLLTQYIKYGEY